MVEFAPRTEPPLLELPDDTFVLLPELAPEELEPVDEPAELLDVERADEVLLPLLDVELERFGVVALGVVAFGVVRLGVVALGVVRFGVVDEGATCSIVDVGDEPA